MPMPMRSSDWNMSSACCLVRVMTSRSRLLQTRHHSIGVDAFDPNLLSRNFVAGNALLFGAHVLVLTPESQVLKQAEQASNDRKPDKHQQRRLVILGEESQDVAAVACSEISHYCETDPAAQCERAQELPARVLHRASRQQRGYDGERRGE